MEEQRNNRTVDELTAENDALRAENETLNAENERLQQQVEMLRKAAFGQRSENSIIPKTRNN